MDQSKIMCPNPACQTVLTRPSQSFVKCGSCKTRFFAFCHQFSNQPNTYVRCSKCPNQLYYFFCNKCKDVLCFKNYRMGSTTKCKCGFQGSYVVCQQCNNQMCYPPGKKYEGKPWTCDKCQKPFIFMVCDECFQPIYSKSFKEEEKYRCQNKRCRTTLFVKRCLKCKDKYLDSKNCAFCEVCDNKIDHIGKLNLLLGQKLSINSQNKKPQTCSPNKNKNQVIKKLDHYHSPMKLQPAKPLNVKAQQKKQTLTVPQNKPMQKSFGKQIQSLCKICLDKPAQYIHTKCFHLSTCDKCVDSMKNICPICRTEGEFHRVYK